MTLDRSAEFLFKTSNLYVSIKTDHAPGELLVGPFLSPRLYFGENLDMVHWVISGI